MKLGIINSAFDQAGVDTTTGLKHISRIGFDTVDIFAEAMSISQEEIDLIRNTCQTRNLPITSTVVVSAGLIDFNQPVREFHLQRTKRFLDLAREFESQNLLLVIGEYIWQREVIPPEQQWEWGVECVRELGQYAGERGLEIALELEPFRLSLLNSVPKWPGLSTIADCPTLKPTSISAISSCQTCRRLIFKSCAVERPTRTLATVTARFMEISLQDAES